MQQYMDGTASKNSYSLTELTSDGAMYTSYFSSKAKAKSYMRKNCGETSAIYLYLTKCIKIYDPIYTEEEANVAETLIEMNENDTTYSPELDFTNMTVWKYGSGYLLEPPTDSDYFGQKYFHNGWWMNSQNGWFFKAEEYDWIMDNGAILATEEEEVEMTMDFSNMKLWSYGKGYLLEPTEEHELFGEKYFHSGFWNTKQKGWFFKASEYDWLVEHGAIVATDDDTEIEYDEPEFVTDFSNMTLWSYGKGYLLEPTKEHSLFGEKYFHSGFWNAKQKGWFFKASEYDWLVEHGAILATEDASSAEEQEEEEVEMTMDFSNMKLWSYGKGYLLEPTKEHELFGEKYFHSGFWNAKQKGWFFKASEYDWLVEHGAVLTTEEEEKTVNKCKKTVTLKETDDLTNMTLEKYGKGYILKTYGTDKRWGQKYFLTGFWNAKQHGWFFRTKYYDELLEMGAMFIKTEPMEEPIDEGMCDETTTLTSSITNDSFEYVHSDSEFTTNENKPVPKFVKYGKGWLLKSDKNYKYNGINYYEDGWWIDSKKGWFFKNKAKSKFMNKHFGI